MSQKKRVFRIIILQAYTSERSDSRRLESDLSEVSACRMMILKVRFFWDTLPIIHKILGSFNLRKQSNQVYYSHWSQYLGLGRCCWGADTLDPVGDKYIALHSCCDIQEEIPLLTWNLIPLKMSGTEPPSKGFILTSLIFRLRIWRGGHGIDENALSHHSSPQGTRTR